MKKILLAAAALLSVAFTSGAFAGDCGSYGYSTFAPGGCYSNRILVKQECAPVVVEQPVCPAPCPPVVACPQPVVVCPQPQPVQRGVPADGPSTEAEIPLGRVQKREDVGIGYALGERDEEEAR